MPAERRFHRLQDLVLGQVRREDGGAEGGVVCLLVRPRQLAAARAGSLVVALLLGDLGELLGIGILLELLVGCPREILGCLPGGIGRGHAGGLARVVVRRVQDVPDLDLVLGDRLALVVERRLDGDLGHVALCRGLCREIRDDLVLERVTNGVELHGGAIDRQRDVVIDDPLLVDGIDLLRVDVGDAPDPVDPVLPDQHVGHAVRLQLEQRVDECLVGRRVGRLDPAHVAALRCGVVGRARLGDVLPLLARLEVGEGLVDLVLGGFLLCVGRLVGRAGRFGPHRDHPGVALFLGRGLVRQPLVDLVVGDADPVRGGELALQLTVDEVVQRALRDGLAAAELLVDVVRLLVGGLLVEATGLDGIGDPGQRDVEAELLDLDPVAELVLADLVAVDVRHRRVVVAVVVGGRRSAENDQRNQDDEAEREVEEEGASRAARDAVGPFDDRPGSKGHAG